jgi:hypothetical protein
MPSYNPDNGILIQRAVQSIYDGTFTKITHATREIPHLYSRVKNRLTGRISHDEHNRPGELLTISKEEGLIIWLNTLDKLKIHILKEILEYKYNRILATRSQLNNQEQQYYSNKLAPRFIKHHNFKLRP